MVRIELSVMIDRSAEDVWKFLTDLSNMPKWDPGVLEARQTSTGPSGGGATFETTHSKQRYKFRITEYELNHKYTFEFASGLFRGTSLSQVLEVVDGKTRLIETINPKIGGFYKLLGALVAQRLRKVEHTQVENIKRLLETK